MIFFPIITMIITALLTSLITKSWSSPGSFFCFCWSFFLVVPIIFAYDYRVDHLALWFITIFSMSLSVGSIMATFNSLEETNYKNSYPLVINYNFLNYSLLGCCFIGFFGIYMLLRFAADIYSSGNYVDGIIMIPNLISIDRYSGILNYPFIIKYSLYFIYPANLLGGLTLGTQKKSKKIIFLSFLPLIGAILLGIIEGARTSIILGIVLFFSAWLSTLMFSLKRKNTVKKIVLNFIVGGSLFLVLFTLFFVFIQWLRQGMNIIIAELFIDQIRAYFFGYLSAFSKWLSLNLEFSFGNGLITFAGPFNLFGLMERPLGFYDSINIASGISTNIYTAFRGIITDFSITGSIFIAFIIGFSSQRIFQNNQKTTLYSVVPISMFYSFTLYSPLISIFHYNSILFSWLILSVVLFFANHESLDNYS